MQRELVLSIRSLIEECYEAAVEEQQASSRRTAETFRELPTSRMSSISSRSLQHFCDKRLAMWPLQALAALQQLRALAKVRKEKRIQGSQVIVIPPGDNEIAASYRTPSPRGFLDSSPEAQSL